MARETDGDGRTPKSAGFYKHRETGVVVELTESPEIGTPMIDAYIQAGYVKITDEEALASRPVANSTEGDEYTEKTNKNGRVMYYRNGKLISKDAYENR